VWLKPDLLAPVRIEQLLLVELDRSCNESAKGGVRFGFDRAESCTEVRGELACPERETSHDPKAAAATALESPKQIRIGAGIGDPYRATSRDHLGLKQTSRGQTVVF